MWRPPATKEWLTHRTPSGRVPMRTHRPRATSLGRTKQGSQLFLIWVHRPFLSKPQHPNLRSGMVKETSCDNQRPIIRSSVPSRVEAATPRTCEAAWGGGASCGSYTHANFVAHDLRRGQQTCRADTFRQPGLRPARQKVFAAFREIAAGGSPSPRRPPRSRLPYIEPLGKAALRISDETENPGRKQHTSPRVFPFRPCSRAIHIRTGYRPSHCSSWYYPCDRPRPPDSGPD